MSISYTLDNVRPARFSAPIPGIIDADVDSPKPPFDGLGRLLRILFWLAALGTLTYLLVTNEASRPVLAMIGIIVFVFWIFALGTNPVRVLIQAGHNLFDDAND